VLGSLLALLLTASPGPVPPTSTLETPRFRLVHTARAEGAAKFLAGDLEHLRDDIATLVGRDWPGVTEVRLGFGREEYEALALPNGTPPGWAVALAYPGKNVVLVEAHSLVQGDGQVTLRHELVHVALGELGHGWPHWFQEGLAMELTQERRYRLGQYETLSHAVAQGRVFHFDDLREHFPLYADDVEIAYAQSAAFVEFLRDRHGQAAFRRLIDRVQAGDPFETAFGVAFHTSLSVEERAFRDQLPGRYPWWPLVLSGESLVWGTTAVLMVAAYARRRQQVAQLRAEQARLEHLEDMGDRLLERRFEVANDDLDASCWLPPEQEHHWVVHSVRVVTTQGAPQPQAAGGEATTG
jgi:hypothetical protein